MKLSNSLLQSKVLVIGCGSIGERHIHNLKKMGMKNIAVFDIDKSRVNYISRKYHTEKFSKLESALSFKPDISFICSFPLSHIEMANRCVESKSHIFIEKPISSELKGVRNMLNAAKRNKIKVSVGYNTRFDQGLNIIRKKLHNSEISPVLSIHSQFGNNIKNWRPGTKYQEHYILKKGSGIILDDSHEYDYLRWLFEDEIKSVYCQTRKTSNIKTETESFASITLKSKKGLVANLNVDYLRPSYERGCYIIGEKGSLQWDYNLTKPSWSTYSQKVNSKVTLQLLSKPSTVVFNNIVKVNDMYVKEIQNFLESIIHNKKPLTDGFDALNTLKIGIAALKSSNQNKIISL